MHTSLLADTFSPDLIPSLPPINPSQSINQSTNQPLIDPTWRNVQHSSDPHPDPHPDPDPDLDPDPHSRGKRMLDDIIAEYSNIFGTKSAQKKQPVVFLPDGSKKPCKPSGQGSAFGYMAFAISLINSVVNAANNINNNQNNNNNNDNNNNLNNANVNIASANQNQGNANTVMAGRRRQLSLAEREKYERALEKHYRSTLSATPNAWNQSEITVEVDNVTRTLRFPLFQTRRPAVVRNDVQPVDRTPKLMAVLDLLNESVQEYLSPLKRFYRSKRSSCPLQSTSPTAVDESILAALAYIEIWNKLENECLPLLLCRVNQGVVKLGPYATLMSQYLNNPILLRGMADFSLLADLLSSSIQLGRTGHDCFAEFEKQCDEQKFV